MATRANEKRHVPDLESNAEQPPPESTHGDPPPLDNDGEGLLDQVDALLRFTWLQDDEDEAGAPPPHEAALTAETTHVLRALRSKVAEQAETIAGLTCQLEISAGLESAAIARTGEVTLELQEVKRQLFTAKAEVARATRDGQRLADPILESMHDAVFIFEDLQCVACNDRSIELMGLPRARIVGGWPDAFDLAHYANGRSAASEIRKRILEVGEEPLVVESMLPTAGQGPIWAEMTISTFERHGVPSVLMVVRNVTGRKRIEAELRRNCAFLNNLLNAIPDQLFVTSPDHTLVLANEAYCRVQDKQIHDIVGRNTGELLPEEARQRAWEAEHDVLTSGVCHSTEEETKLADGRRTIQSVKRSSFEDEDNNRYVLAIARDITADRMREDRLRVLASVFNEASEGVAILTSDGTICEANPAFVTMIGANGQSPLGMRIEDVVQFDVGELHDCFDDVGQGHFWVGKARRPDSEAGAQHLWVSMSPSTVTASASPRIIALVSDITELEHAQEKLRSQALKDNLTGLPNRRCFCEHLRELTDLPETRESGVTVCFIDLDDFKHVNDSSGHAAGDALLRSVGKRLEQVMGPEAFVARFGGDEFAMILTAQEHQPPHVMQRLAELLQAFRTPFQLADTEAQIGLSIGVTSFPSQADDVDKLMCNADIAMYAAKSTGKNVVRVFNPEMEDSVNTRHQVHTKLRRALKENEISLEFQPKVATLDGAPMGCEALARWTNRAGEIISPAKFIPVAEQTGLITSLGEQVVRQAALQATEWARRGVSPSVAVNVSANQLRHSDFVSRLRSIVEGTGAQPEWIEIEITEDAMMENVEHAIKVVRELAEAGYQIAIDDFGTGYLSLSYLKDFRIHTLKVDLSFVREITDDQRSAAVVQSIVSLGAGLGLNVIAEGVENAQQAEMLAQLGCTAIQGYHVARPMNAAQYAEWYANH